MSVATFDTELFIDDRRSSATVQEQAESSQPPSKRASFEESLWAFDEPEERSRFDRIQTRLIQLESALFEEFGSRINHGSRECLLRLFVACPSVKAPLISARPDGVLTATWRSDSGAELAVRCIGTNSLHFAIATRSPSQGQTMDRLWGTAHSASMFFAGNLIAREIADQ